LAAVPDPRQRRGRRYPWSLLLVLIAAAVASGQSHGRAIGQWVREHAPQRGETLGWPGARLPSEATLRRALRGVDVAALEEQVGRFTAALAMAGGLPGLRGPALDGKEIRGGRADGRPVRLVGLARHDGVVLGQVEVAAKANEIGAAPQVLAGRDRAAQVPTVDALLAQRALAREFASAAATM
jgi:hypothetical protein